ncbi:MAG: 50S ribosomal protein L3 [Caldisericaceae bacterium]
MAKGILGLKLGMTSIYLGDEAVPVTVVKAGPCVIVDKKTPEKNGYSAVELGFVELKPSKVNKPMQGVFKKNNVPAFRFLKEFREMEGEVGDTVTVESFKDSKFVKVTGISKGKGFAGPVKRWNFAGWPASHGHGATRRRGSIGQRAVPGRVFKGMKMAGHLGQDTITIRNLEIVKIDPEKNLILIKGNVPGVDKSLLFIRA